MTIYMKTNLLYISVLKSVPSIWKISIDKCLSQICNEILVQECISWHCQILTVIFLPLENFCSCKHGVFIWKITIQTFSNVTKSNSIILTVSLVIWWNHFPNRSCEYGTKEAIQSCKTLTGFFSPILSKKRMVIFNFLHNM